MISRTSSTPTTSAASNATGHRSTDRPEPPDDDLHTVLALMECGPGGISGHDPEQLKHQLWQHAKRLLGYEDPRSIDAAAVAEIGAKYRQLLEEWCEQLRARDVVLRALAATERAVRAAQRREAATHRQFQPRVDKRSPNRPTRVDVDPAAWEIVKRRAMRLRQPVAALVGSLITQSPIDPPAVEPPGEPARRFARLFIDDKDWADLRVAASTAGITVSRMIGLIVEEEAHRLGWTTESDR